MAAARRMIDRLGSPALDAVVFAGGCIGDAYQNGVVEQVQGHLDDGVEVVWANAPDSDTYGSATLLPHMFLLGLWKNKSGPSRAQGECSKNGLGFGWDKLENGSELHSYWA